MFIRINLPASYKALQEIKTQNFPYKQAMSRYMQAIARVQTNSGYDIVSTIGMITHKLTPGVKDYLSSDAGDTVRIDYEERDPSVVAMYKGSGMTQKNLTRMIIQLMLRMHNQVGSSLAEMTYLINTMDEHVGQAPKAPIRPTVPDTHVAAEVNQPVVDEPDNETESPDAPLKIKTKKRAGRVAPKPAKRGKSAAQKEAEASVTNLKNKVTEVSVKAERAKTDAALDRLVERASKLKEDASEVEGQVVTTNPLLGDFF